MAWASHQASLPHPRSLRVIVAVRAAKGSAAKKGRKQSPFEKKTMTLGKLHIRRRSASHKSGSALAAKASLQPRSAARRSSSARRTRSPMALVLCLVIRAAMLAAVRCGRRTTSPNSQVSVTSTQTTRISAEVLAGRRDQTG